jgi:Predicted membrane protein
MNEILLYYLIGINMLTFFVYGIDKWKAQKGRWRIPEASLLTLAIIGGSIGAWVGMKAWHHKTMHKKFKYGLPLILLAQIALIILCTC